MGGRSRWGTGRIVQSANRGSRDTTRMSSTPSRVGGGRLSCLPALTNLSRIPFFSPLYSPAFLPSLFIPFRSSHSPHTCHAHFALFSHLAQCTDLRINLVMVGNSKRVRVASGSSVTRDAHSASLLHAAFPPAASFTRLTIIVSLRLHRFRFAKVRRDLLLNTVSMRSLAERCRA